jgi:hypothetical protein
MLGCGEGFRPGAFPDRFGTCRGDLTLLVPHETERNAHKEGAFHTPPEIHFFAAKPNPGTAAKKNNEKTAFIVPLLEIHLRLINCGLTPQPIRQQPEDRRHDRKNSCFRRQGSGTHLTRHRPHDIRTERERPNAGRSPFP